MNLNEYMTYLTYLTELTKAEDELSEARKIKCICSGFVLQYEGHCGCGRDSKVSMAESKVSEIKDKIINNLKLDFVYIDNIDNKVNGVNGVNGINKVYIAKEDTWFDAGTKVKLIDDYRNDGYDFGLFEGLRGGKIDQETCTFDEFIIIDIEVLANKVVTETVRRISDNIDKIIDKIKEV